MPDLSPGHAAYWHLRQLRLIEQVSERKLLFCRVEFVQVRLSRSLLICREGGAARPGMRRGGLPIRVLVRRRRGHVHEAAFWQQVRPEPAGG